MSLVGTAHSNLFVYGTLMRRAQGALGMAQRARLEREGVNHGAATLAGAELFDFGRYPGLVLTGNEMQIVHGELITLSDAERSFVWLDEYEGFSPGQNHENDYDRVERTVRRANGEIVTAWVYVFLKDVLHGRPIPSGRWMDQAR